MDKRILDLLSTIHAEASYLFLANNENYCGGDFILEACAGCQNFFACEAISRGNKILAELREETNIEGLNMNREIFETKCQLVLDWARIAVRNYSEIASTQEDIKKAQDFLKDISSVEPYIKNSYLMLELIKNMIGEYQIILQLLDKKLPNWRKNFTFDKTCQKAESLVNKILGVEKK